MPDVIELKQNKEGVYEPHRTIHEKEIKVNEQKGFKRQSQKPKQDIQTFFEDAAREIITRLIRSYIR